jgi:hypothetical protein
MVLRYKLANYAPPNFPLALTLKPMVVDAVYWKTTGYRHRHLCICSFCGTF